MFHDLSWTETPLVSAFAGSILYGMNVIASGACARVLLQNSKETRNRVLLTIAFIQFTFATVHVATLFQQLIDGFTRQPTLEAVTLYFMNQATAVHITQDMFYLLNNLIADGILVWRLYVIWGYNYWIALPFVLLSCAEAVCGFASISVAVKLMNPQLFFNVTLYSHWLLGLWSFSIATQLLATALIAWKLWFTMYSSAVLFNSSKYWSIIWIIVESGAALSVCTIFLLALFESNKIAGGILAAILGQLGCLVPSSIVFRVSLNRPNEPTRAPSTFPSRVSHSTSQEMSRPTISHSTVVGHGMSSKGTYETFELKSKTYSDTSSTHVPQEV